MMRQRMELKMHKQRQGKRIDALPSSLEARGSDDWERKRAGAVNAQQMIQ